MGGQLNVYNLGSKGVNVDTSPLHLEDGELTLAQNVIQDPIGGKGGIVNRPGLAAFSGSAAAGTLVGGIGVPLSQVTAHTTYIGRQNAVGWWKSTSAFTTTATLVSLPARAADTTDFTSDTYEGIAGCFLNGQFYYPATGYLIGTANPSIRAFDGTTDVEVARVAPPPANGYTISNYGIVSMIAANGVVYFITRDGAIATRTGRVMQLTPATGVVTQLGSDFTVASGHTPQCLCWHAGRLWMGTYVIGAAAAAHVSYFRPGVDTDWTTEHNTTTCRAVSALTSFNGELYVGLTQAGGTAATIERRSSLGAWTAAVDTGATTNEGNTYSAGVVIGSAIYHAYVDALVPSMVIRKYDGSSWTTAFTAAGTNRNRVAVLSTWNNITYAAGGTGGNPILLSTPDGTTWTDRSSSLVNAGAAYVVPAIFEIGS